MTILSPEKEVELLEKPVMDRKSEHTQAIVITALNTGMRKREILDLTKNNVDFKNRNIHVTYTKNWEVRDIPMNELLTSVLKQVINKSQKLKK